MKGRYLQPAIVGGLVTGVLSALPIISAANICCCLWVVGGGVVAAYMLQQALPGSITPGDGALVGLLAGLIGSGVYLIVSIPITILIAPMERALMERVIDNGTLPPEFRQYVGTIGTGVQVTLGFLMMLIVGSVFSTLGGLVGAFVFRKPKSPATDIPEVPAGPV